MMQYPPQAPMPVPTTTTTIPDLVRHALPKTGGDVGVEILLAVLFLAIGIIVYRGVLALRDWAERTQQQR